MVEPKEDIKEEINYVIKITGENKTQYFASKRNGKLLIPFDNVPSFMLKNDLKEIEIISNKPINTERKITFYKRK